MSDDKYTCEYCSAQNQYHIEETERNQERLDSDPEWKIIGYADTMKNAHRVCETHQALFVDASGLTLEH